MKIKTDSNLDLGHLIKFSTEPTGSTKTVVVVLEVLSTYEALHSLTGELIKLNSSLPAEEVE